MVELCRHIKTDGHRCGTPAVHGTLYCYHHSQRKAAIKKARVALSLENPHMRIPFVFPEDRAAIQHNLYLVALALDNKRISDRTAGVYTSIWRACRINLGKTPLIETDHDTAVRRVILTPEGDEISTPQEVLDKGELLRHGPDCPCRKCAEKYRNAPPEHHHHDCACGLCERSRPVPCIKPDAKPETKPDAKPSGPANSISTLQAIGVPIDGSSSMECEAIADEAGWVAHSSFFCLSGKSPAQEQRQSDSFWRRARVAGIVRSKPATAKGVANATSRRNRRIHREVRSDLRRSKG